MRIWADHCRIEVIQIASGYRGRGRQHPATIPTTNMSTQHSHTSILDPRQVFLTPAEVMARYR
jgi:hypothetical protein